MAVRKEDSNNLPVALQSHSTKPKQRFRFGYGTCSSSCYGSNMIQPSTMENPVECHVPKIGLNFVQGPDANKGDGRCSQP